MSNPTPGPWKVAEASTDGGYWIETEAEKYTVVCGRGDWPHRAAESLANARLIAAAPDLLEAAREAVNALADYIPQIEAKGASLSYGRHVVGQLLLAIAKASGAPAEPERKP